MINFDDYDNENKTLQKLRSHNQKWPYISDHPYRKTYLYAKDPYEAKYQYLIKKREIVGLNHYDDPKALMIWLLIWLITKN